MTPNWQSYAGVQEIGVSVEGTIDVEGNDYSLEAA